MGMRAPVTTSPDHEPIDWPSARSATVAGLNIEAEYERLGLRFVRVAESGKGWREAFAIGRDDAVASAAVHVEKGIYKDSGGDGLILSFFDFAMRFGQFGSWMECMRHYAERAGVTLGKVRMGSESKVREAEYPYRDASGDVKYVVLRYRHPTGKKTFAQHPVNARGELGYGRGCMDNVTPLPYRLPEMLADPAATVIVVEGEKDAERLASLGLVATTNHQGANSTDRTWPHMARYFVGRDVVVIPDQDTSGHEHARRVCGYLDGIAASVKVATLPGLGPVRAKGGPDVSDWLDLGHEVAELLDLADQAPAFDPSAPIPSADGNLLEALTEVTEVTNSLQTAPPVTTSVTSVTSVNASSRFEAQEWPHPRLYKGESAAEFPLDVLPAPLVRLCEAGASSMSCPVDYFAVAALGLAGAAIGSSVNLMVKTSWKEAPNLYVPIVGPAGSKKSPVVMAMSRALAEIDHSLRKDHELAMALHEQAVMDAKQDDAVIPDPPTGRQLTLDDATREAVAQVLAENERGVVVIKDEISAWVASLNAYKGGKGDDKQFWMSCYTGAPIKVNRKGARVPLYIPRPCVSIVGGLTPSMLPAMRDSKVDDGWLDRLSFSYPEPTGGGLWNEDQIDDDLMDDWAATVRRLFSRPMEEFEGRNRPQLVRFTADAKPEWVSFFNAHYLEQQSEHFPRSLSGPWSKMVGTTARLALIVSQLHQAYDPGSAGESPAHVSKDDIGRSRELISYFKSHFMRVKAELTGRITLASDCAEAILRFLRRRALNGDLTFTGRDITLRFHRYAKDEHAEALAWLAARHAIRQAPDEPRKPGEMGRPKSAHYEINPHLEPLTEVTEETEMRESGEEG